jgi:hypothetical protein
MWGFKARFLVFCFWKGGGEGRRPHAALHSLARAPSSNRPRKTPHTHNHARQNNYALSKHLTEQAVAARHGAPFAVHIARPAFVIAVAGRPYPGRAAAASACRARPPRKPPCFQFKT